MQNIKRTIKILLLNFLFIVTLTNCFDNKTSTEADPVKLKEFPTLDNLPYEKKAKEINIKEKLIIKDDNKYLQLSFNSTNISISSTEEKEFGNKTWPLNPPLEQKIDNNNLTYNEFVYPGKIGFLFYGKYLNKDVAIKFYNNKNTLAQIYNLNKIINPNYNKIHNIKSKNDFLNKNISYIENELEDHLKIDKLCKENNIKICLEVYRICNTKKNILLIMEKLRRPTYSELIENLKSYILKLLENLVFLEKNNIIHSDLSPLNIAFIPKLIDFQKLGENEGTGIFSYKDKGPISVARSILFLYLFDKFEIRLKENNTKLKKEFRRFGEVAYKRRFYERDVLNRFKEIKEIDINKWQLETQKFVISKFFPILCDAAIDKNKYKTMAELYEALKNA